MKNLINKIFLAYPIILLAAIVDKVQDNANPDYEMAAQQIINHYNFTGYENTVAICESPYFELLSQKELDALLQFVYSRLGNVNSFTVRKFNNETSEYKLECASGLFKMILVVDSENKITAIDFAEEKECVKMNIAA